MCHVEFTSYVVMVCYIILLIMVEYTNMTVYFLLVSYILCCCFKRWPVIGPADL